MSKNDGAAAVQSNTSTVEGSSTTNNSSTPRLVPSRSNSPLPGILPQHDHQHRQQRHHNETSAPSADENGSLVRGSSANTNNTTSQNIASSSTATPSLRSSASSVDPAAGVSTATSRAHALLNVSSSATSATGSLSAAHHHHHSRHGNHQQAPPTTTTTTSSAPHAPSTSSSSSLTSQGEALRRKWYLEFHLVVESEKRKLAEEHLSELQRSLEAEQQVLHEAQQRMTEAARKAEATAKELAAAKADLESAAREIAALKAELETERRKVARQLQEAEKRLNETRGELDATSADNAQLRRDLESTRTQKRTMAADLAALSDKLTEMEEVKQQLVRERKTREATTSELQRIEDENQALKARAAREAEERRAAAEEQTKRADQLSDQLAALSLQVDSLSREKQSLERSRQSLQESITLIGTERDAAEQRANDATRAAEGFSKSLAATKAQLDVQARTAKDLTDARDALRTQCESEDAELRRVSQHLRDAERNLVQARSDQEATSEESALLRKDLDSARAQLRTATAEVASLTDQTSRLLSSQLEDHAREGELERLLQSTRAGAADQHARLRQEIHDLSSLQSELRIACDQLRSDNAALINRNEKSLEEHRAQRRAEAETHSKEVARLTHDAQQLQSQLISLHSERDVIVSRSTEVHTSVHILQTELREVVVERDTLMQDVLQLEAALRQAKAERDEALESAAAELAGATATYQQILRSEVRLQRGSRAASSASAAGSDGNHTEVHHTHLQQLELHTLQLQEQQPVDQLRAQRTAERQQHTDESPTSHSQLSAALTANAQEPAEQRAVIQELPEEKKTENKTDDNNTADKKEKEDDHDDDDDDYGRAQSEIDALKSRIEALQREMDEQATTKNELQIQLAALQTQLGVAKHQAADKHERLQDAERELETLREIEGQLTLRVSAAERRATESVEKFAAERQEASQAAEKEFLKQLRDAKVTAETALHESKLAEERHRVRVDELQTELRAAERSFEVQEKEHANSAAQQLTAAVDEARRATRIECETSAATVASQLLRDLSAALFSAEDLLRNTLLLHHAEYCRDIASTAELWQRRDVESRIREREERDTALKACADSYEDIIVPQRLQQQSDQHEKALQERDELHQQQLDIARREHELSSAATLQDINSRQQDDIAQRVQQLEAELIARIEELTKSSRAAELQHQQHLDIAHREAQQRADDLRNSQEEAAELQHQQQLELQKAELQHQQQLDIELQTLKNQHDAALAAAVMAARKDTAEECSRQHEAFLVKMKAELQSEAAAEVEQRVADLKRLHAAELQALVREYNHRQLDTKQAAESGNNLETTKDPTSTAESAAPSTSSAPFADIVTETTSTELAELQKLSEKTCVLKPGVAAAHAGGGEE